MMYEPDTQPAAEPEPELAPAPVDQDEEMEDLFGNDEDRGNVSDAQSAPESDRLPSPERERRQALEYEEEDEPGQVAVVVREANVAFPNIPIPKTSNGENWTIRTPNYVKVDSRPFHPETYMGPEEEEAQQGETLREKSMTIKLNVENTLRWRWLKDQNGTERKQSNARVIRWSDGSLSLRLGKELFDIKKNHDTTAAARQQSQSQSQPEGTSAAKSQGYTYLVAQHRRAQVLQAETSLSGYMTLQPTGMQSETHRMLVRSVGQKHNKVARLRMVDEPTVDPERQLQELIKAEARKSKKKTSDYAGKPRKSRRSRVKADIWSDEDDEGAAHGYSDEEDEARSPERRKTRRHTEVQDEDNRGGGNYQEDDFVVADSSEDEDGSGGRRKRKRDDEMEEDPLDKLESKIEENQRRESKQTPGGDDTMDIESEEEDEFKVKSTGGSAPRRKRAIDFDDDEGDE